MECKIGRSNTRDSFNNRIGSLLYLLIFYAILLCYACNGDKINLEQSKDKVIKVVRIELREQSSSEIQTRSLLIPASLVLLFTSCECSLEDQSCHCCFTVNFITKGRCCLRVEYSKTESAINGFVDYKNKTLINFQIKAVTTKDAPKCFSLPFPLTVGVCLQFYGIKWHRKSKSLNVCSNFEMSLFKRKVYKTDFGCFVFGNKNASSKMAKALSGKPDTISLKNKNLKDSIDQTKCFLALERGEATKPCL